MSPEASREGTLPKDALVEITSDLFNKATFILSENKGFGKALVEQVLKIPDGTSWFTWRGTKLNFESRGSTYMLDISRSLSFDKIAISTENENIYETIYIELLKGEAGGTEIDEGKIAYSRMDWKDGTPMKLTINTSEAAEKIRQFLRQI